MLTALLFSTAILTAQKQSDQLPRNKDELDSSLQALPGFRSPLITPLPKDNNTPFTRPGANANSFESNNPGTVFLHKTQQGNVYRVPLDNMAVLVPDMARVEKMPVLNSRTVPGDKMPNPYRPGSGTNRKKQ